MNAYSKAGILNDTQPRYAAEWTPIMLSIEKVIADKCLPGPVTAPRLSQAPRRRRGIREAAVYTLHFTVDWAWLASSMCKAFHAHICPILIADMIRVAVGPQRQSFATAHDPLVQ
jgi:hypothetical protein